MTNFLISLKSIVIYFLSYIRSNIFIKTDRISNSDTIDRDVTKILLQQTLNLQMFRKDF